MNTELDEALIKKLQTVDTPTVCNALELLIPKRRGYGFTTSQLVCTRQTATHGGLCTHSDYSCGAPVRPVR